MKFQHDYVYTLDQLQAVIWVCCLNWVNQRGPSFNNSIVDKHCFSFSASRRFKLLQQHGSSTCTKHHLELCGLLPAKAIVQYGKHQIGAIISCERGQNVTGVCAVSATVFTHIPLKPEKNEGKPFFRRLFRYFWLCLVEVGRTPKCSVHGYVTLLRQWRQNQREVLFIWQNTQVCCKLRCKQTMNCMVARVILLTSSDATF
jgi:predicted DNA-binding ribbon-helix-helix protein